MKRLSYVLSVLIALSALPAQAATLTATKTVAGQFSSGGQVTYTIVMTNSGTAQADNPGFEFTDTLPPFFFSTTANATSGTTQVSGFPPLVTWDGAIAASGSVTITITASLGFLPIGTVVSNQGTVNFDSDGNNTNDATVQTDDPSLPGASDPTVFSNERKGAGSARPSATLLLPYFEVDPAPNFPAAASNPGAPLNTVLTVGNAEATAVLTRVTVWTDYGIPTLSFHLYLTGYDIETIDLGQLFDGVLPRSASAGQDPFDNISNKGPFSQDINFASCAAINNSTRPPSADIIGLRRAHSGFSSSLFGNQCASRNHNDGILRGYITIDTVNSCNDTLLPNDAGYEGLLTNQNLLWGSYSITNSPNNYSDSGNLAHIRHGAGAGDPIFYRRFNGDTTREGLGSVWGARYLNGGAFDGGTVLRVWREPRTKPAPVACTTTAPAFLPGRQGQIVAFDEQENPIIPGSTQFAQPFPLVTQQVKANGSSLPLASPFGWLYLNLNHGAPAQASQSYVSVAHSGNGRFRVSNGAVMLQAGLGQALPSGASLGATKAVSGNFNAGGTVTYAVEITNEGLAPQQNNAGAEFTDVLPAQLTLVSATATSGTATATVATNTVTWNGGLGIGASTTVTITATVKTPLAVGTVVSNQGQLMCDGNADGTNEPCGNTDDPITFPSFGPGPSDPTIFLVGGGNRVTMSGTKTVAGAPFLAGGNVVYTVVLRNNGPGTLLNDAGSDEFTDSVPGSLIFQSATASSGAVSNSNPVRWNGTLAPNATVTLTIRGQINPIIPTGTFIGNQGSIRYDANGDGTLDATRKTDNPATPDVDDATGFTVGP
ncbi:MAG: DUF11 domain-containing protein [Deltaproteobacteria bacterium]|nr:DUF11 domain-containing protein [Deltaproteobacteria bacterium]